MTTPTLAQLNSACLSYRHDFGLMGEEDQERLRWAAKQWRRAWGAELGVAEHTTPVTLPDGRTVLMRPCDLRGDDSVTFCAATPAAATAEPAVVDSLMELAQVFASAWSLVGGQFDDGQMLGDAEDAKAELRSAISRALATPPAVASAKPGQSLDNATSFDDFHGAVACVVETAPEFFLLCWAHVAEKTYADRPRIYLATPPAASRATYQLIPKEVAALDRALLKSVKFVGEAASRAAEGAEPSPVTGEMVSRFLCWRLPDDFAPDCGITFTPNHPFGPGKFEPVGTNLLTADQARAMLEHVLAPLKGESK